MAVAVPPHALAPNPLHSPSQRGGLTLQQRAAAAAAAAYEEEMASGLAGADEGLEGFEQAARSQPPLGGRRSRAALGASDADYNGALVPSSASASAAAAAAAALASANPAAAALLSPMAPEDASWLDDGDADLDTDVDVSTARGIKRIVHNLNEKISKLYNWHLVEIDLVSRQQVQLNSLQSELDLSRSAAINGSIVATPTHTQQQQRGYDAAFASPTGPLGTAQRGAGGRPVHSPFFSPQTQPITPPQRQQFSARVPAAAPAPAVSPVPASTPSPDLTPSSQEDWAALLHALQVLEQTDPNAPEVAMLRQILHQEQAKAQQPQQQVTPVAPMQQQPQQPSQAMQQPYSMQQAPQQQQTQMPPQQLARQQQPIAPFQPIASPHAPFVPAPVPQQVSPPPLQHSQYIVPASLQQPALSPPRATPSPSLALSHGLPPPVPLVSAATVLSSFWSTDVRHWCLELDEELKTATIALGQLLEVTNVPVPLPGGNEAAEAYRKQVAEFEQILQMSHMLESFGLPSHVAALLPGLPPELLASIRGAAHRLEATKKALHAFLSLVHSTSAEPNGPLLRELRSTILASGVTQIPAPTIEQMADSVAHDIAHKQNAAAAAAVHGHASPDAQINGMYGQQQHQPAGLVRPVPFQPIHPQQQMVPVQQPQQQQAPPRRSSIGTNALHVRSHTIASSTSITNPRRWN